MIWSSVRKLGGGAIITPAAPASIDAFASERIAAKPGAETPTMICMVLARLTKRIATCSVPAVSSLRRHTENAEHGDAVAADLGVEVGQAVDRTLVDPAVVMKRRRRDGEGTGGFCGAV